MISPRHETVQSNASISTGRAAMIAQLDRCDPRRLPSLLENRLPSDEAAALTDHIERCADCRTRLERLAGELDFWTETKAVLSDVTLTSDSGSVDPAVHVHLPERIGPYEVKGFVGHGGMATVYKGWDAELNRALAIKVLHPHLASTGTARTRFLREAQAAAAVVHPCVVPIYGVHNDSGRSFLIMPLITGGSLQQRLDRDGSLETIEILRIGLQIAEGLAAAHAQGVVHRDIKPANILLEDGDRRVLISDFGLARTLDDATLTASGMVAGTPAYMSPEQARGEQVDHRTDLFSLGAVLFTMATGRRPFDADNPLAVIRQIAAGKVRSVQEFDERQPDWLDRLIARFLAPDPKDRLQSASQAADLLRGCLAHLTAPSFHSLPEELAASRRRMHWLPLTAIVCGAIAIGAVLSQWWGQAPTNRLVGVNPVGVVTPSAGSMSTANNGSAVDGGRPTEATAAVDPDSQFPPRADLELETAKVEAQLLEQAVDPEVW
jgi:serine/threonine-protein kinase